VTAVGPDTDELRRLEADVRQAWRGYSDRLRALIGDEYERVEHESWAELQTELRRVERRRESLNQTRV
jgi:acyl-CoA-binding protein